MADLEKHRDEVETFEVDFTANLGSGELLTGTPTVTVARRDATVSGDWDDLSSEFVITGVARDGTDKKVQFTLGARTTTGQRAGDDYVCHVECVTDAGRTLVETPSLEVKGEGAI